MIYESMITEFEFGGSDHSSRTERFNGENVIFDIRSGAPSIVYNGVQSLKKTIFEDIVVFL